MKEEKVFVGFWKRVWMSVIDDVLLLVYALILILFRVYVLKISDNSDGDYIYTYSLITIIPFFITFLFYKYKGGTPGKIARKVKIIDVKTGEQPTDKQFFLRLIGLIVSGYSFLLSYIHVGLDSRKQAWHDKLSGTAVIHTKDIENYKNSVKCKQTFKDKKHLKIEMYIFAFFILLFITFKFFQFYDEPLLSGAKEWLYKNSIVESNPEENGFYYLVGFDCLEEDDPFQKGYEWVQIQNERATSGYEEVVIVNDLNWTDEEKAEHEEKNTKRYSNDVYEKIDMNIIPENFILHDIDNTLNYYVNKRELIDSLKTTYNFLNKRYKKIISFSRFENTQIPHFKVVSPIFMGILNLKRLNLAWIGKEFKIGNRQESISELSNEIELSRFLLNNAHSIIGKIFATLLFQLDLQLLSELIDESEYVELTNLYLTKLTPSEKNWKEVAMENFNNSISSSLIFNDPNFIKKESNGKISEFLFKIKVKKRFKLNNLINETYNAQKFMYHLSQLNAKDFMDQKDNYLEPEFNLDFKINLWDQLFNPVGAITNVSAVPIGYSYISQFHDIDGYINMLKLKNIIIEQNLTSDQIPAFLESHKDSLNNPYTEDAIKWDSTKSVLYFNGPYDDDLISDGESKFTEVKLNL